MKYFSKILFKLRRTNEGRTAIEQYVYSDSNMPPDLHTFSTSIGDAETEIQAASAQELAQLVVVWITKKCNPSSKY